MADEALKATERQFISLLDSASEGMPIHLSLYTLPDVPRNEASSRHIASPYSSIDDLWEGAARWADCDWQGASGGNLTDEPYWESFTKTLAWAQENAHSTIWSCLAAHAAILHLDGIDRAEEAGEVLRHLRLCAGGRSSVDGGNPRAFRLPHSRWNGLSEDELTSCGYSVLTTDRAMPNWTPSLNREKAFRLFPRASRIRIRYSAARISARYRPLLQRGNTKVPVHAAKLFRRCHGRRLDGPEQRAISDESGGLLSGYPLFWKIAASGIRGSPAQPAFTEIGSRTLQRRKSPGVPENCGHP